MVKYFKNEKKNWEFKKSKYRKDDGKVQNDGTAQIVFHAHHSQKREREQ